MDFHTVIIYSGRLVLYEILELKEIFRAVDIPA